MKSLLIGTHRVTRTDGQGRVCLEIARAAAAAGWNVTTLCDEADPLGGVEHVRIPAATAPTQLIKQSVYKRRLTRAIDARRKPGVTVLLNGDVAGGAASDLNVCHFVHSAFRKQVVPTTPHAAYRRLYAEMHAWGERAAYANTRRVVAVSDVVRTELIEHAHVPAERIVTIPNGVDPIEFRPATVGEPRPLRDQLGVAADELLAIFVGDLRSPRKGFGHVLHAVARVPGVRVAAVGGHEGGPFPAMAKRFDVADRVHFLGRRSDVPALMRQADVMPFPSGYEPFGLVVTEALASGVPVICGPEVGAAAVMTRPPTLAAHDDVDGLATELQRLRDDPAALASLRLEARSAAESATWSSMADQYMRLLDELDASHVN